VLRGANEMDNKSRLQIIKDSVEKMVKVKNEMSKDQCSSNRVIRILDKSIEEIETAIEELEAIVEFENSLK
jgi:hypothetical protein